MRAWARWGGTKRWGQLPDLRYATNGENVERTISRARDEFVEIYVTETQNVGIAVNVAKLEAKWGDNPPNRRRTMSGLIFESRVDANGHGHTYVKMTPQAEQDYDEKMARQGFHKVRVELPGSRHGFVWERARAATPAELAEALARPLENGAGSQANRDALTRGVRQARCGDSWRAGSRRDIQLGRDFRWLAAIRRRRQARSRSTTEAPSRPRATTGR